MPHAVDWVLSAQSAARWTVIRASSVAWPTVQMVVYSVNRVQLPGMQTVVVPAREALTRFGWALSDPTRTQVLLRLRDGAAYPSELAEAIGVSRQALSNHLTCLRGCGLVVAVPEGRRTRYELTDPRIAHALEDLLGLVVAVDPACGSNAENEHCC